MPLMNSREHSGPRNIHDSYAQLGLESGASMHDIETAYWRFAHELRGQPAMTPYTAAYEALVNRGKPRTNDVRLGSAITPETPKKHITLVASPSKLGWPAN